MEILKYQVREPIEIFDALFLQGDIFYISSTMHLMNGNIGYGRKIFKGDREYLGILGEDHFQKEIKGSLEEISQPKR